MQTRFWRGKLREKGHLKDLGIDAKIIFEWFFKEIGCKGVK
jgi:hypothetical protein